MSTKSEPQKRQYGFRENTLNLLFEDLVNSGNQSWVYEAHYEFGNNHGGNSFPMYLERIKITIERNAYDTQSYAKCEVFAPAERQWNYLVSIPFTKELKCYRVSYTDKKADIKLFQMDALPLLERMQKLL